MFKVDIITIFPEMITPFLKQVIIKQAIINKTVNVNVINLRDFTNDIHKTTDDYPYGGGPGMVMKLEPLCKAVESLNLDENSTIICPDPAGKLLTQEYANYLSKNKKRIVILCGRYEGIDERFFDVFDVTRISIGDYVVAGGELPALIIMESFIRLIPGAIGNQYSSIYESFNGPALDFPCYTRPAEFRGYKVPDVLLSGNHKNIKAFRIKEAFLRTLKNRPDIFFNKDFQENEYSTFALKALQQKLKNIFVVLVHFPVYNKNKEIVCTAVTNLDIHDIARSISTYGLGGYFVLNPMKSQLGLVKRIIHFWTKGKGAKYNSNRNNAIKNIIPIKSIEELFEYFRDNPPLIFATSAKEVSEFKFISGEAIAENEARKIMLNSDRPVLLLFGTGWGLTDEIMSMADYILKPIKGLTSYRHLSVRSACAIILDRLFRFRSKIRSSL